MMPARVPVPSSMMATGAMRERPETANWFTLLNLPIIRAPTRPPSGSAISGSTTIPATGRRASSRMATSGALMAAAKPGSLVPSKLTTSSAATLLPLLFRRLASQ